VRSSKNLWEGRPAEGRQIKGENRKRVDWDGKKRSRRQSVAKKGDGRTGSVAPGAQQETPPPTPKRHELVAGERGGTAGGELKKELRGPSVEFKSGV